MLIPPPWVWSPATVWPLRPSCSTHCPFPPSPPRPLAQSITALAHLRAAVLYIVDISEHCGYTLKQQATLFHSIKPLFSNKPVLIVCNKTDVTKLEDLRRECSFLSPLL